MLIILELPQVELHGTQIKKAHSNSVPILLNRQYEPWIIAHIQGILERALSLYTANGPIDTLLLLGALLEFLALFHLLGGFCLLYHGYLEAVVY